MNPERCTIINGIKIEEYDWNGKYVVYRNDKLIKESFEEAIKKEEQTNDQNK